MSEFFLHKGPNTQKSDLQLSLYRCWASWPGLLSGWLGREMGPHRDKVVVEDGQLGVVKRLEMDTRTLALLLCRGYLLVKVGREYIVVFRQIS